MGVEEAPLLGVYAAPPLEGALEKAMGGVYVGVWGSLRRFAVPLHRDDQDEHGRWTGVKVKGKNNHVVVVLSCYRPPAGCPGGLVAREGVRRGWGKGRASMDKVQEAFFQELGARVRAWRGRGWEVVLAGDFNANSKLVGMFRAWHEDLGLIDVRARAGDTAPTFTYTRTGADASEGGVGESTLDFILLSAGMHEQWCGQHPVSHTRPWVHRELGHSMLTVPGRPSFPNWLSLGVGGRQWDLCAMPCAC